MIDKPNRKNSDTILTRYDRNWPYPLYRWLRLSKTQQRVVSASPETCMTHLQQAKDYWKREIFTNPIHHVAVFPLGHGTGYEFQARIVTPGREGYQIGVNGLIVEDGEGRSLLTLRTYSDSGFMGLILMLGSILFSVIQHRPWDLIVVGITIFGTILMFFYLKGVHDRMAVSNMISDYIAQSKHLLASGQSELTSKQAKRLKRIARRSLGIR